MQLTTAQISYIENRLIKNGVNYWDIRIELLDHVVLDVESNLKNEIDFKDYVHNAFIKLGWNGSFESITKRRLFVINKIVRKQYFNKIIDFFKKPKLLFGTILFFLFYFSVFKYTSFYTFKIITLVLLFSPISFGIILYFSEFLKKRKSGYLTYTSFYIFFSILLLNIFFQFFKPDGIVSVSKETQSIIWFTATFCNTIFSLAGILVHLKTVKKLNNTRQQLFS